jgi:hypothetical protein
MAMINRVLCLIALLVPMCASLISSAEPKKEVKETFEDFFKAEDIVIRDEGNNLVYSPGMYGVVATKLDSRKDKRDSIVISTGTGDRDGIRVPQSNIWFLENDGKAAFSSKNNKKSIYHHHIFETSDETNSRYHAIERFVSIMNPKTFQNDLILPEVHEETKLQNGGRVSDETRLQRIYYLTNPGRKPGQTVVDGDNTKKWVEEEIGTRLSDASYVLGYAFHPYELACGLLSKPISSKAADDVAVGCTIGSGKNDDGLLWFARTEHFPWDKRYIDKNLHNVRTLFVSDVDNDGWNDIVASGEDHSTNLNPSTELRWYRNPKDPACKKSADWSPVLIDKVGCCHGAMVRVPEKDRMRTDLVVLANPTDRKPGNPNSDTPIELVWYVNNNNGEKWERKSLFKFEKPFETTWLALQVIPISLGEKSFKDHVIEGGFDNPDLAFVVSIMNSNDRRPGTVGIIKRKGKEWVYLPSTALVGNHADATIAVGDFTGSGKTDFVAVRGAGSPKECKYMVYTRK